MKIYRDTELIDIPISDRATEVKELMVEHSVSLDFELADYLKLEKGDYVVYNGKNFYLNKDYIPTVNKTTGGYKYDLVFYDITERFKDIKLKYLNQGLKELDFKLTTSGYKFLEVVIQSLSEIRAFQIGSFPTEYKEIHFQNVDVFSGLSIIAETYEVEWWFEDDVFYLGKHEHGDLVTLEYDKELDEVSFSSSSEKLVTRLYAFGSTRNIPQDYRVSSGAVDNIAERRLRMPVGTDYIDLFDNLPDNQIIEDVKIFDEIYPRQKNKVLEVTETIYTGDGVETQDTVAYIIRSEISLNESDITPGKPLMIAFQTGKLTGREFELLIRDNKFEIKYTQDENIYIPNPTLKPEVGDEFFLFNIKSDSVIPALIPVAENELKDKAREFMDKLGSDLIWDAKTRSIYCETNGVDLDLGQKITLKGTNIGEVNSRIRGYEKNIYNKYECTYKIGGSPQYSRLGAIEKKAEESKTEIRKEIVSKKKEVERYSERQWRDAKETMEMLQGSLANFTNSISPITVNTMQMLVGDETLQFRFVNSKTNPQKVQHIVSYNKLSKQLSAQSGILQHLTLGVTTISPSHKPNEYKYWDLSVFTSGVLEDGAKSYYLYAKCSKTNSSGVFLLSETSQSETETDFYFLVGTLNSEYEEDRSFVPLYGYSEILPGRITTDKIVSQDGGTFFDLLNGIIGGNITFVSTGGNSQSLAEWADDTSSDIQDAQDNAIAHADKITKILQIDATTKKFINPCSFSNNEANKTGALVIKTPIKTSRMVRIHLTGYNYQLNKSNIDLVVGFYHYPTAFIQYSYTSAGDYEITKVRLVELADGTCAIIIGDVSTVWQYPKLSVEEALVGFNPPPDSYIDGWSMSLETDLSAYTTKLTTVTGRHIQTEITKAQADATNAQSSATNANNAVNTLNSYVDGAFKDGVVSEAEAKAIEKYINIVNTEKANLEATYNKLYANTYLEGTPKTTLLNAKVSYFGSVDSLLNAINTAIADGKTTVAEKNAVDTQYNSYKSYLASFQGAIEDANKAIQTKLDAISKGYVENLQVGDVNILNGSKFDAYDVWGGTVTKTAGQPTNIIRVDAGTSTFGVQSKPRNTKFEAGKTYTMLIKLRGNITTLNYCYIMAPSADGGNQNLIAVPATDISDTVFKEYSLTFTSQRSSNQAWFLVGVQPNFGTWFEFKELKIVEGTKATKGWSLSVDDTQAEISNAQTTANNANNAVNNLNTYVDGAFKDGVISQAEAKAIEKYLNSVNETKLQVDSSYSQVYNNTYLVDTATTSPKTNLYNAKKALDTAYTDLINSINTAIADGKTTVAEKTDVDTKYALFNTALATYQVRLEEANNAIKEAIAQSKIDNTQIGARNLIAKKFLRDWNLVNSSITQEGSDADGNYLAINQGSLYTSIGGSTALSDIFQGKIKYKANTQYAFKVRWKLPTAQTYQGLILKFHYTDTSSVSVDLSATQTTIIEQTLITAAGKTVQKISCTYGANTYRTLIYDIQLTEGNKQTAGYIVAQEDIDAQIDAIEVGGVNLIKNGNFFAGLENWNVNYDPAQGQTLPVTEIIRTDTQLPKGALSALKITTNGINQGIWQNFHDKQVLELNRVYTLSFIAKASTSGLQLSYGHENHLNTVALTTGWLRYRITFTPTEHKSFIFYAQQIGTFYITNIQLEVGNKATDFKNGYLEDAIKGSAEVNGGLVLGNVIGAKDSTGVVKSYMSGLASNPTGFATGVKNFGQANETKSIDLRHDGSGHLAGGKLKITSDDKLLIDLDNFKVDEGGDVSITGALKQRLKAFPIYETNFYVDFQGYPNVYSYMNHFYRSPSMETGGAITLNIGFFVGTTEQGAEYTLIIDNNRYNTNNKIMWVNIVGSIDGMSMRHVLVNSSQFQFNLPAGFVFSIRFVCGWDGRLKVLAHNYPSVLLAGFVTSEGGINRVAGMANCYAGKSGTGTYIVTHNFGHNVYTVQVTPDVNGYIASVDSGYSANSFTVYIRTNSGTLVNSGFHFSMI